MLSHSSVGSRGRRRGGVLVWLVLCLGVIIVIVALGTDGGRMMEERRRAQAAADAAALAAAAHLYDDYLENHGLDVAGTARAAALQAAAANGYEDGVNATVTVNVPPLHGDFAGKAEHVEVIIETRLTGSFSAAFNRGELPVRARAVARGRPQELGLMVLKPSGANAFEQTGSGIVNISGGSVIVNSSDPAALSQSGSGTISAAYYDVVGGIKQASEGSIIGKVYTGVDPTPDPLRTLPAPNLANYPVRSQGRLVLSSGTAVTLLPGVYQGGISISGKAVVTMAPGIYIMDGGGFEIIGGGSLVANEVMIYNTGGARAGPVSISGTGSILLSSPTDGIYQGICIFQDRTLSQTVTITGTGNTQIAGAVYAPAAAVQLSGNSSSSTNTLGGAYICNTLQISGNGNFQVGLGANRPRVPEVKLVE